MKYSQFFIASTDKTIKKLELFSFISLSSSFGKKSERMGRFNSPWVNFPLKILKKDQLKFKTSYDQLKDQFQECQFHRFHPTLQCFKMNKRRCKVRVWSMFPSKFP